MVPASYERRQKGISQPELDESYSHDSRCHDKQLSQTRAIVLIGSSLHETGSRLNRVRQRLPSRSPLLYVFLGYVRGFKGIFRSEDVTHPAKMLDNPFSQLPY
jgi:hypothetical protein